jgi:hypothetical protein
VPSLCLLEPTTQSHQDSVLRQGRFCHLDETARNRLPEVAVAE